MTVSVRDRALRAQRPVGNETAIPKIWDPASQTTFEELIDGGFTGTFTATDQYAFIHSLDYTPTVQVLNSDKEQIEVMVRHLGNRVTLLFRGTLTDAQLIIS